MGGKTSEDPRSGCLKINSIGIKTRDRDFCQRRASSLEPSLARSVPETSLIMMNVPIFAPSVGLNCCDSYIDPSSRAHHLYAYGAELGREEQADDTCQVYEMSIFEEDFVVDRRLRVNAPRPIVIQKICFFQSPPSACDSWAEKMNKMPIAQSIRMHSGLIQSMRASPPGYIRRW